MSKNIKYFEKIIKLNFYEKYKIDVVTVNNYIIENIIFNEKSHLVATFKDKLIMDDDFEFFKRFYTLEESLKRIVKYTSYYEKFNFLFPNYTVLPESKYLYQNINRKQRIIDEQQNEKKIRERKENKHNSKDKNNSKNISNNNENLVNNNTIFNSSVYDSILKSTNNSCFSQFGIDKNKEVIDSIGDIQEIIKKINNNPDDLNNMIKLDDSPSNLMNNNNNLNYLNEVKEKNINGEDTEKFDDKIFNTNYCYNKFKNRTIKNLLINKNNKNISYNNTPLSSNKKSFFSPLYTKVNARQNISSNIPIVKTNNIKIQSPNNIISKNANNSNNKFINNMNSFIYRKLSPMNIPNKLSFSVKRDNIKTEYLKTIDYFPSTTKSNLNPINPKKKNLLKIKYYFNDNNNMNTIDYSTKNKNINNNLNINNAKLINNKILYSKRRANSELNNNLQNNIKCKPLDNILNNPKNNCIKEKSNSKIKNNKIINKINKMRNINYSIKLNNIQNHTKTLSINQNTINNIVKPFISDSLIDTISNKIKKENKNYISKRIYNLINNHKNNTKSKNLNILKNNIISLKKRLKINKAQNNNSLSLIKNKLISSLEKNSNKDTFSFTFNSNISNNIIHINNNKVPINNLRKRYIFLNDTPNSIKKKITFRQFINNNYSTINNTYNCNLFSPKSDINKGNNILYPINTSQNFVGNYMKKKKYVYETNNMNNRNKINKMNNVIGFNNKNLVINDNKKKKILIIRRKENQIKTDNNKNILNNNNKKFNKLKNKGINNALKLPEFEKTKLLEPGQNIFTNENLRNKYKIILKQ